MRKKYYDIFRDLYVLYQVMWSLRPIHPSWDYEYPLLLVRNLRIVTDALDDELVELKLTKHLRPDAKHFLLVNLHQLVVLPLKHDGMSDEKASEIVRRDLNIILNKCLTFQDFRATEGLEITGHMILKTICSVWHELSISELSMWG